MTRPVPHLPRTRRRAQRTALYIVVAALLGVLFVPITAGAGFVVAVLLTNQKGPVTVLFAAVFGGLLAFAGLRSGARNSFHTKPIAPRSVAIAVAVPPALFALYATLSNLHATFLLLVCAAGGAWGMYRGAATGARDAAMSVGIGDQCAHCGYDLTPTPAHQVCPECGGKYRFDRAKVG